MDSERFEVMAKVPRGASKEQFRTMLQNLLADRFNLIVHRGKKETRVYDLVIAKSGPKLKQSSESQIEEMIEGGPNHATSAKGAQVSDIDKDGYPVLTSDCSHCVKMANGKIAVRLDRAGIGDFIEFVAGQLGQPVFDRTNLQGKYDIKLRFDTMERPQTSPMTQPPTVADDLGLPIAGAIESQLGLRLEARRGDVDAIIVDKAERIPAVN